MSYKDEIKKIQQGAFAELYKIKAGDETWYYTSYEQEMVFEGNTYKKSPLKRGTITFDDRLKAQRIKISAPLADPMKKYIGNSPIEPTEITVIRVFIDNPTFFKIIFRGEIIGITMVKGIAEIDCESSSLVFKNKLPPVVHQAFCNNRLYDSECGVDPNNFKVQTTVTISGNDLSSTDFSSKPNGWFTNGHVKTTYNDIRLITNHVGNTITLQIPFDSRMGTGATVTAFAGCSKKPSECLNKFSNFANFKGMPFIPANNPVVFGA